VRKSDIKVGTFVLFGLLLATLVIFLLGETRRVFEKSNTYQLSFRDIAGLKKGAPVQMGGMLVGHVKSIAYAKDPKDPNILVDIEVVAEAAPRVRADSVASITNKGFLGDKMLLITQGKSPDVVAPGATIPSEEPGDFIKELGEMKGDARSTMSDVKRVAKELADERLHADLRAAVKKVDTILGQVSEGDGYAHRLLADPEEAKRIARTIDNLDRSAAELAGTLHEFRLIAEQVRTGPGFAHDVIYGDGVKKPVEQVGLAAEELALAVRDVRAGSGVAHDILFGGKPSVVDDALGNVAAITGDFREIVRGMKQGKGTLGALLVDPSVYEDVKRLVGNVERNAVLRSLVRYSIQQNDRTAPGPAPEKAR